MKLKSKSHSKNEKGLGPSHFLSSLQQRNFKVISFLRLNGGINHECISR